MDSSFKDFVHLHLESALCLENSDRINKILIVFVGIPKIILNKNIDAIFILVDV